MENDRSIIDKIKVRATKMEKLKRTSKIGNYTRTFETKLEKPKKDGDQSTVQK